MKRENWKYIMVGLGLGFFLAGLLLVTFGGKEKERLSDREIIDRARDLGMIFLRELRPDKASKDQESAVPGPDHPDWEIGQPGPKEDQAGGQDQAGKNLQDQEKKQGALEGPSQEKKPLPVKK